MKLLFHAKVKCVFIWKKKNWQWINRLVFLFSLSKYQLISLTLHYRFVISTDKMIGTDENIYKHNCRFQRALVWEQKKSINMKYCRPVCLSVDSYNSLFPPSSPLQRIDTLLATLNVFYSQGRARRILCIYFLLSLSCLLHSNKNYDWTVYVLCVGYLQSHMLVTHSYFPQELVSDGRRWW